MSHANALALVSNEKIAKVQKTKIPVAAHTYIRASQALTAKFY